MKKLIIVIAVVALANQCGNKVFASHTKVLCHGTERLTSANIRWRIITIIHTPSSIIILGTLHVFSMLFGSEKNHAPITPPVSARNHCRNFVFLNIDVFVIYKIFVIALYHTSLTLTIFAPIDISLSHGLFLIIIITSWRICGFSGRGNTVLYDTFSVLSILSHISSSVDTISSSMSSFVVSS